MIHIYKKNDLTLCGCVPTNMTPEQEIKLNAIPNYGGIIEDYETIETGLTRFHLENINGVVTVLEDETPTEKQKQSILFELSQLDMVIPRIIEDIISQGNFIIHQSRLDIISKKIELRRKLSELGV